MERILDITEKLHSILNAILVKSSKDKLTMVPKGYNNNILWNIGHLLVTQQSLVYQLSKLPTRLDSKLIKRYSKGTFPEKEVLESEIKEVAEALLAVNGWIKEDYRKGLFKEFIPYTTSTGVTLNNIEDAVAFNMFHIGLHLGTIRAIQKLVVTPEPA